MSDRLSAYLFDLPEERIAQHPSARREDARLMLLDRDRAGVRHHRMADLLSRVRGDELLILNDVRVSRARLLGHKESGGAVEALVLNAHESEATEALVMARSSKPLRPGQVVTLGGSDCVVQEALGKGRYRLGLPTGVTSVAAFVEAVGQLPLPPYIKRPSGPSAEDEVRYQTVFAGQGGAVAAPTAGLHFTDSLLDGLRQAGCELQMVTLFVGPGTFTPVRTEDLDAHQMHAESYLIGDATADAIRSAKRSGRPVLAVGTTALRALEGAAAQHGGEVVAGAGTTEIFIRPGYSFQVVDQLLTNFHLPGSTLLMLVSALAGRERMLQAYGEAVDNGYRFFSYGDGMLIR